MTQKEVSMIIKILICKTVWRKTSKIKTALFLFLALFNFFNVSSQSRFFKLRFQDIIFSVLMVIKTFSLVVLFGYMMKFNKCSSSFYYRTNEGGKKPIKIYFVPHLKLLTIDIHVVVQKVIKEMINIKWKQSKIFF